MTLLGRGDLQIFPTIFIALLLILRPQGKYLPGSQTWAWEPLWLPGYEGSSFRVLVLGK